MQRTTAARSNRFGALLRVQRQRRHLSQEELAARAEVSTRHLSCLETGKALPSRTMVLVLGAALDLALRERNTLLEAAGFTAAYANEPLDAPEEALLARAVDLIFAQMEPYGAVAIDPAGAVLRMNRGAVRLLSCFVDMAAAPPEVFANVYIATLHPRGLRGALVNFDAVSAFLLERLRRECEANRGDAAVAKTYESARALAGVRSELDAAALRDRVRGPFLEVHLHRGDLEARYFSTLATIGTPIDATAERIAVETFFPADEATRTLSHTLARLERGD